MSSDIENEVIIVEKLWCSGLREFTGAEFEILVAADCNRETTIFSLFAIFLCSMMFRIVELLRFSY